MPFHKLLHIILSSVILITPSLISATQPDELHPRLRPIFKQLDFAIAHREEFTNRRTAIDDSLKRELAASDNTIDKLHILEKLSQRYIDFQVDSAVFYGELARDLAAESGLSSKARRYEAAVCGYLPSQGQLTEAMVRYAAIDTAGMELDDRLMYLTSGTRLYFVASCFYPSGPQHEMMTAKGRTLTEQYLRNAPYNSDTTRYMSALLSSVDGRSTLAEATFKELLDHRDPTNIYYPLSEQALGFIHLDRGDTDAALGCLARALIAELTTGCRSGESAYTLAHELLKRGDTSRGHAVLEVALENARRSGWRVRTLQTAEISPVVVDNYRKASTVNSVGTTLLVVLLLCVIAGGVWLYISLRRARIEACELRAQISAADEKQQLYFNRFLKLCAVYIETLENFTLTARRKIKMNQADDLYKMINSGDMLDEQAKRFYEIFDSAFCHAYPKFLEQLNKLLLPDKQVSTPAPGTLTTELRILAFMKIGFDESAQIARILSVSVNTIYTYRNRMRSRALSRDTFEDDIKKIGL